MYTIAEYSFFLKYINEITIKFYLGNLIKLQLYQHEDQMSTLPNDSATIKGSFSGDKESCNGHVLTLSEREGEIESDSAQIGITK